MSLIRNILLFIIGITQIPGLSQTDTSSIVTDTILSSRNTIPQTDTLSFSDAIKGQKRKNQKNNKGYRLSKDAITEKIIYHAIDSNITYLDKKEINLYNDAQVEYQEINLKANHIVINFEKHTAQGSALRNQNGVVTKRASFTDGATQATYYDIAYNFDTEKAFVKNLKTKEGEFSILGEKSKFVKGRDTINKEDQFFNEDAIITTCTLDHPHFGIRTSKLKFIPDKLAVMGPSQLELAGIPTPLVLPFGFLPLIKGQSSGLIFPDNYEYNENYGFGFREIGYYFPINDYIDFRITGDIYTRGSHGIRTTTNYKKRYAYSGNLRVGYNNFLTEDTEGNINSSKTFSFVLSHKQDPKAHPYRNIGGSINISGNQHDRRTYNDAESVLNNTYRSSFSYNYNFPDSPFKFSMGLSHSQNNISRNVNITLPSANLRMNTIQPFKRKDQIGGERWYEKINLGYRAKLENSTVTTDTTILSQETIDNLNTGFSHNASLSFNGKIFKYINVAPSANYSENYYLKRIQRTFDPSLLLDTTIIDSINNILEIDTTFGQIIDETLINPTVYRNYNLGIDFNTQLFYTKIFQKGKIRGIRHLVKPSVSFNYRPDLRSRYEQLVDTDLRAEFNDPQSYSPFPNSPFSSGLSDRSMGINWSLNNTLEAKYYSKRDSTVKKIKIFENYRLRGNYNFAADSMHWSEVQFTGNSRLFKGISTLNFAMNFTPYVLENGTRNINKYLVDKKRFPLQLKNITGNFNSNIRIKQIVDILTGRDNESNRNKPPQKSQPISEGLPSLTSLIENFAVSHNLRFSVNKTAEGKDTFTINTHTLGLRGNLKLTRNWSLNLGNISYNFRDKKFIYPSLSFQRDLHCWSMSFAWFPSNNIYNFHIGVKSSQLNFLKYDYGQNTFGRFN